MLTRLILTLAICDDHKFSQAYVSRQHSPHLDLSADLKDDVAETVRPTPNLVEIAL